MQILSHPISISELSEMASNYFGDLVKAVVDVRRELLALNAELHSDLESYLLQEGSRQGDLWGINLYPELGGSEDFIEFDSMINVRPAQSNRSRGVEDPLIQQKIIAIVQTWILT